MSSSTFQCTCADLVLGANEYYKGAHYWAHYYISREEYPEETEKERGKRQDYFFTLMSFMEADNLQSFTANADFKTYGIHLRYTAFRRTLLHEAYRLDRPKFVRYLRELGADERISDANGRLPLELAAEDYQDELPRVVNVLAQNFFKADVEGKKDPAVLYNTVLSFIKKHRWRYCDTPSSQLSCKNYATVRSLEQFVLYGEPCMSYSVNCADLTNLFIEVARKVGLIAYEVWYERGFLTIDRTQLNQAGVTGEFKFFDPEVQAIVCKDDVHAKYYFENHCVALLEERCYDLTLQCTYHGENAVLNPLCGSHSLNRKIKQD